MMKTSAGVTFELKCGHGTAARGIGTYPCPTLKECADQCAARDDCQSADWSPNACNLKGEWIPTFEAPYQTWFPVEQREQNACPAQKMTAIPEDPAVTAKASCPSGDGKVFEAEDGNYFLLQCCVHEPAGNIVETTTAVNYADCINKCGKNDQCKRLVNMYPISMWSFTDIKQCALHCRRRVRYG